MACKSNVPGGTPVSSTEKNSTSFVVVLPEPDSNASQATKATARTMMKEHDSVPLRNRLRTFTLSFFFFKFYIIR